MAEYIAALGFLGDPLYWTMLILAVVLLGTIGLIPGLGSTTIAAIAIPFLLFNFGDNPTAGIIFLAALGGLNNTLDSVPAVLLGYPGAATQVTFLEGHQLAMRGRAAYTLGAIYSVSAIGGVVGAVALLAMIPFMRPILVRFSFPEIAAMAMFGVLMVSVLSRGAMIKGVISGLLGVLASTIGTDGIQGLPRLTFEQIYLLDGLPLIPTLIGFFALPELIDLTMTGRPVSAPGTVNTREVLSGARYGAGKWRVAIRQSMFGVFMGAIPGIGSAVIDWLSYAFGIALSKDKTGFGKGSLDGVLFAESAQNSKEGGQAIPTLAFGIPGGSSWAIVLVGLLFYGIAPGLGMLDQHLDVMVAIVVTLALGNLLITMLGMVATGQIAKVTLVPYPLLAAALFPLVFIAAFQSTTAWGDILVLIGAGMLGLAMKWLGWPRPPFILGFILGPIIEKNLWTAVGVFGPVGMLTRPISIILLIFAILSVIYLTKAMARGTAVGQIASAAAQQGGVPPVQGGSGDGPAATTASGWGRKLLGRPRARWTWDSLFPFAMLAVVIAFLVDVSGLNTGAAKFLPLYLSAALIPLILYETFRMNVYRSEQVDIMDLGMRTGTDRVAFRAFLGISAWLAAMVIGGAIVGLQYATVAFAVLFGFATLQWRGRKRLWALVPGVLVAAVVFGVLDAIMHVIWPDRVILDWLLGR
ncbi:MAG: tripartite tricarboxylate transporter permease [Chloroflexi bacterium]|nr:tripartite tricarboxylate transporter permease [Chloroflexota bacterium]